MSTRYIDNLVTHTVSYIESTSDIKVDDARTIRMEGSNIVSNLYIGSPGDTRIVKILAKNMSNGAVEVTYFIDESGSVHELNGPFTIPPMNIEPITHLDEDGDLALTVTGPGTWSTLATIM